MCCSHKRIDNITDDENSEEDFLGSNAINELGENSESWKVPLKLQNVQTTFKLDTGADVTVIPENVYQKQASSYRKQTPNWPALDNTG